MSTMSSFFNVGQNPFSTQIGIRIEQATDGSLASENWALYMEICDLINENEIEYAKDAMKAIRKRLAQKNFTVIMYTLTVLETCVKNCGKPFHLLVSNKEFIQELVKLIGPKNDPPAIVQEKVLSLIQIWADAFRKQPELNGVVQVYQELKNKGIEFPMTDIDSLAPIFTPQRSVPESKIDVPVLPVPVSPQHVPQKVQLTSVPTSLAQEQIGKLQSELDIVALNMSIFGEMLTELKPGLENPADYKLLKELSQTCKEMQGRIVELVGKINHDEFTAELLRLNDELNNLFLRYARYENNRDPNAVATPSTILGAAMGIPDTKAKQSKELIDLGDEAIGGLDDLHIGFASSQLSQISTVTAQSGSSSTATKEHKPVDEFDMLAQSRNTTDTIKPNLEASSGDNVGVTPAVRSKPTRESDFDEMAAWLETSHEDGHEDSVTSKEFERFLAERAAVADSLPNEAGPNVVGNQQKNHKDKTRKDDDDVGLLAL